MPSEHDFWYRLGYTLERARQAPTTGARKLATFQERRPAAKPSRRIPTPAEWPAGDQLLASGAVALAAKVLAVWRPRRSVGVTGLVKGSLAGAAAALAVEVVRPLLEGRAQLPELDEGTLERILAGAGQGLVYGAVVEPRIPGPAVLKGTVYASAEFAVHPVGGLSGLLGSHAPLRRVPVLGAMLEGLSTRDRSYVEHLAFGVALAVIYGYSLSSSGTLDETG